MDREITTYTYKERYKDIRAKRIRNIFDTYEDTDAVTFVQMEVYGEQLDGTPVWMLIHIDGANTTFEEVHREPEEE